MKNLFSLVALILGLAASPVFAQRTDMSQQKIDFLLHGPRSSGYSAHSSGQSLRNARQSTQELHDYTQTARDACEPESAKIESERIGNALQSAKKSLVVVKRDAEHKGEPDIRKKAEAIEKHLDKALERHKQMDSECCKDKVDGTSVAGFCDEVLVELDKALAEQQSLIRLMTVPPAKHPRK